MTEWIEKPIKSLGRVVTGKTPPKVNNEYFENGKGLFVSPKDLGWDHFYVNETETVITERALEKFKNQVLPKNAVMFTSLSFAFGKMGIASKDCLTNQQINSIIVNNDHDFRFIYYLLKTYRPIIFSYNSGIDTPIVPKSVFESILVKCPPLKIQQKIAAILSAYDDLIENNKRRIALLEKMAEEIYREWFVRFRFPGYQTAEFEKGIPKGWRQTKFGLFCKFEKGKNPDEVFDSINDELVFYVNVDTLSGNLNSYAKVQKNSVACKIGDILMLMDGSRSGLTLKANVDGIVGSTLSVIKVEEHLINYVYEYLKAMHQEIIFNNTGSAIPHANKDYINRMMLFIPDNKSLIREFNEKYEVISHSIKNLADQNINLSKTKESLLPRLISGKLSIEDLDIQFPPSMQEDNAA